MCRRKNRPPRCRSSRICELPVQYVILYLQHPLAKPPSPFIWCVVETPITGYPTSENTQVKSRISSNVIPLMARPCPSEDITVSNIIAGSLQTSSLGSTPEWAAYISPHDPGARGISHSLPKSRVMPNATLSALQENGVAGAQGIYPEEAPRMPRLLVRPSAIALKPTTRCHSKKRKSGVTTTVAKRT
jgi:hypothetical protein